MIESLSKTGVTVHNPQKTKKRTLHIDDIKHFTSKTSSTLNQPVYTRFTLKDVPCIDQGINIQDEMEEFEAAACPQREGQTGLRKSTRARTDTRNTIYKDFEK